MATKEMLQYIMKQRSAGQTDDQIMVSLQQAGWSAGDVVQLVNSSTLTPLQLSSAPDTVTTTTTTATPVSNGGGGTEIADLSKATWHYFLHDTTTRIMLAAIFLLCVGLEFLYVGTRLGYHIFIVGVWCILTLSVYMHVRTKLDKVLIQQLGQSIGFSYAPRGNFGSVGGTIFRIGQRNTMTNVLSGMVHGRPARIFSYTFVTVTNDNNNTIHTGTSSAANAKQQQSTETHHYTVFETTLPAPKPDMVCLSHRGSMLMNYHYAGGVPVVLEGDFNKYFSLFAPKGHETAVYETLPPDVMAILIDRAKQFSFEFNGSHLYIFWQGDITNKDAFNNMFKLVNDLDDVLAKSSRAVTT